MPVCYILCQPKSEAELWALSSELLWDERSCTNIPIQHGSELNRVTVTLWRCWVRFTFHIVSLSDSVRSDWIRPSHRSSALEALEAMEDSHGRCGDVLRISQNFWRCSMSSRQSYFQVEYSSHGWEVHYVRVVFGSYGFIWAMTQFEGSCYWWKLCWLCRLETRPQEVNLACDL